MDMYSNDLAQTEFNLNKFPSEETMQMATMRKLKGSKNYKLPELKLTNLRTIPEELKNFIWLKKLILSGSTFNEIRNLPPNLEELLLIDLTIDEIDGETLPDSLTFLLLIKSGTSKIVNLKNSIVKLVLMDNLINEISNFPNSLELLNLENNVILDIPPLPQNLKVLNLSNNLIDDEHMPILPNGIETIKVAHNKLCDVFKIPNSVKILDLSHNKCVHELPDMNFDNKLEKIDISYTMIDNIDNLYMCENLTHIDVSSCVIDYIRYLPQNLIVFKCNNSRLDKITCALPNNLNRLELASNNLYSIPDMPDSLKYLDISNNNLRDFPNVPQKILYIDIRGNEFIETHYAHQLDRCSIELPHIKLLYRKEEEIFSKMHDDASNYDTPYEYSYNKYTQNQKYYNTTYNYNYNNNTTYNYTNNKTITNKYIDSNPNYIPHTKTITL
jgi:hypothetical protein